MHDPSDEAPWVALPRGAMDRLPDACRRRRAVTSTLLSVFERWGYDPVSTPALEYFEVLSRGLSAADRRGCVRFIAAGSGELVTLRADVTPQIARMFAQRWGGELPDDRVYRWSYAAEIVRQPTSAREQSEAHQVGVELIGDGSPAADAELIGLADESLRAVGLSDFRLDLAHTRVARGLLDALKLSDAARVEAHARLARKDREGLERLLHDADRPAPLRGAIVALCDLFGGPLEVLGRAEVALAGAEVDDELAQLRLVFEYLERTSADILSRLTLDLGEARGFDYYSGVRVRGWVSGIHHSVVRGGRYDGLPRRYGVSVPATGFAIDLDAVESALVIQGAQLAAPEPSPAHLVAMAPECTDPGPRHDAFESARRARGQGLRAWVQPAVILSRAQALAEQAGADRLTFIEASKTSQWVRAPEGWACTEDIV